MATKHTMPRLLTIGAALMFIASACGGSGTSPAASGGGAAWVPDATLLAAGKTEGGLTTIATPRSWCNYGKAFDTFTATTGIPVTVLNPLGGSKDEITALEANKDNKGPAAPDVLDITLGTGPTAKAAGDLAPYKVKTWDSIPASAKDADGSWYGDYYGVLSFEVNTAKVPNVPKDWADLLKPEYHGQVALAGNPTVSGQAVSAVWAAALATGGSLDNAAPGLDFFKKLNDAGNFVPIIAETANVASGDAPIRIAWTYNALADRDKLKGNPPITVVVPASGRFGGMYVQAISAFAPHPNAAKLWMEFLYSDQGQNIWLSGYCTPVRYDDLVAKGTVDTAAQATLPDTKGTLLPTLDQSNKAFDTISKGWDTVVNVVVK